MADVENQSADQKPTFGDPGSSQVVGILVANQPLCLGVGLVNGSPGYVSVITAAMGAVPRWQIQTIGSDGSSAKVFIGTEDGQYWWNVPSDQPFPNCVNLVSVSELHGVYQRKHGDV